MDTSKVSYERKGSVMRDAEIIGDKPVVSHEERVHWGQLTPDELVIEKKLRRKIDALIMPCVILVYLMNYIDRYVGTLSRGPQNHWSLTTYQQQLRCCTSARLGT